MKEASEADVETTGRSAPVRCSIFLETLKYSLCPEQMHPLSSKMQLPSSKMPAINKMLRPDQNNTEL